MVDLKAKIAHELYQAIKHIGGGAQLLSIVGSYGDTLDDDDVLRLLRVCNARVVPMGQARQ
jgi:hypothetical protein